MYIPVKFLFLQGTKVTLLNILFLQIILTDPFSAGCVGILYLNRLIGKSRKALHSLRWTKYISMTALRFYLFRQGVWQIVFRPFSAPKLPCGPFFKGFNFVNLSETRDFTGFKFFLIDVQKSERSHCSLYEIFCLTCFCSF